ncbi:MAG: metallophosphoesterase [Flavobacteriales bacterium]|nr:metallophosphoesterase [Flavobacteriales bacterium]
MLRLIIPILIFSAIELYAFKGIRSVTIGLDPMWRKIVLWLYWIIALIAYGGIVFLMVKWSQRGDSNDVRSYGLFNFVVGFFIISVTTKLLFGSFHLLNDISSFIKWAWLKLTEKPASEPHEAMTRVQFFNQVGLGVAALWAGSLLYGVTRGKFGYRVLSETLHFKDLPDAFDGMRIVQISDMHLGSFRENFDDVQPGFDLINSLDADYIFFTGDMVNNYSDEAEPWIDRLKGLNARFGKFSILGNHDYGDYAMGDQPELKKKSQDRLFEIHGESGFRLLRNENVRLEKDGQSIALLGSENWGVGFHKNGDLNKTMEGVHDDDFKILLSHDPTHWQEEVVGKRKIHLTLSGHTHGAQMGLELPQFGIKFSPVSLRYKRWGGLYTENDQYIYINRGFGFLAFPGRVGMAPEITLIELKKA